MNHSEHLNIVFEALVSEHRRAIIYTLSLQPRSISQLADQQKLSLPAIYKHIRVLESAKLIRRKKSGRTNFLALNADTLGVLQRWLMQYHTGWGTRAETLENYVASIERTDLQLTNERTKR